MREITREKILSSLYVIDIYKNIFKEEYNPNSKHIENIKDFFLNNKDDVYFYDNIFLGILRDYKILDQTIDKYLQYPWSLAQLGILEKNILRIAIYEYYYYYYRDDLEKEVFTPSIVISNSLKLSDKYIDKKHSKFIHGILSAIFNKKNPPCKIKSKDINKYKGSSINNINIFNTKIKKLQNNNE